PSSSSSSSSAAAAAAAVASERPSPSLQQRRRRQRWVPRDQLTDSQRRQLAAMKRDRSRADAQLKRLLRTPHAERTADFRQRTEDLRAKVLDRTELRD